MNLGIESVVFTLEIRVYFFNFKRHRYAITSIGNYLSFDVMTLTRLSFNTFPYRDVDAMKVY